MLPFLSLWHQRCCSDYYFAQVPCERLMWSKLYRELHLIQSHFRVEKYPSSFLGGKISVQSPFPRPRLGRVVFPEESLTEGSETRPLNTFPSVKCPSSTSCWRPTFPSASSGDHRTTVGISVDVSHVQGGCCCVLHNIRSLGGLTFENLLIFLRLEGRCVGALVVLTDEVPIYEVSTKNSKTDTVIYSS